MKELDRLALLKTRHQSSFPVSWKRSMESSPSIPRPTATMPPPHVRNSADSALNHDSVVDCRTKCFEGTVRGPLKGQFMDSGLEQLKNSSKVGSTPAQFMTVGEKKRSDHGGPDGYGALTFAA